MAAPIDPGVDIGHVHLKVADIDRAIGFYRDVLGFDLMQRMGDQAAFLSAGGYHHHIGLNTWESKGGSPPPPGTTGLYHVAIRYPSRAALADALKRLVENQIPISGASDHGVSEAIYLNDPDGNGIELYRDRPREEWPMAPDGSGRRDGQRAARPARHCSPRLEIRGFPRYLVMHGSSGSRTRCWLRCGRERSSTASSRSSLTRSDTASTSSALSPRPTEWSRAKGRSIRCSAACAGTVSSRRPGASRLGRASASVLPTDEAGKAALDAFKGEWGRFRDAVDHFVERKAG